MANKGKMKEVRIRDPEDLKAGGGQRMPKKHHRIPQHKKDREAQERCMRELGLDPTRDKFRLFSEKKGGYNKMNTAKKRDSEQKEVKRETFGEITPFGMALGTIRRITKHKEEEPELYQQLGAALDKMSETDLPKLFFRVASEVVVGNTSVKGLFPLAKKARMYSTAHHVAALARIVREEVLTTTDLVDVGLAEIRTNETGERAWTVYKYSLESFKAAVSKFRALGKVNAAKILFAHVQESENRKLQAQAKKEASAAYRETRETEEVPSTEISSVESGPPVEEKGPGEVPPIREEKPRKNKKTVETQPKA